MISIASRFSFKLKQMLAFARHSSTPVSLMMDSLKLKRRAFVGISESGIKLRLEPRRGESFTFFENLIRKDYLSGGIKLNSGDTVVDVGANIGSFTVLAASIVGPDGHVLAIEPVPETGNRLKANVTLNGLANVSIISAAVDATDGEISLRMTGKSALSTAHIDRRENYDAIKIVVPAITLDRAIEQSGLSRIHLLKVDCEGSEYGIFEAMSFTTALLIDQIAMEVHDINGKSKDGLAEHLTSLGFTVHQRPLCWVAFNNRTKHGNLGHP